MTEQQRSQPHNLELSPAVAAAMARLEQMRAEAGIVVTGEPRPGVDAGQIDGRRRAPRAERGGGVIDDQAAAVGVAPAEVEASTGAQLDQDQATAAGMSWSLRNAIKDQDRRRGPSFGAYGAAAAWVWPEASSQDAPGRAQPVENDQFPTNSAQDGPEGQIEAAGGRLGGDHPLEVNKATVRIAPDMLLYAGQCGDFAAARLYSVIAALDPAGRRLLYQQDITRLLSDRGSEWYLYGRRRLLAVLAAGEGVYWSRDKDRAGRVRIALRSRARIVAHYGIKLAGHEVIMPAAVLLADVKDHGRAREAAAWAAVYAASHAGRRRSDKPIARSKITKMTGLSRWRQRRYERRRGIASRKQIAIDGDYSDHRLAALRQWRIAAWRHVDRRGLFGRRGAALIGRQLPNAYKVGSQYARVNSTRQRRRINAQSADLSNSKGMGQSPVARVFYDDPQQAGKAASREIGRADARPVYWRVPDRGGSRVRAHVGVWRDMARVEYERYLMRPQLEKWGVI